MAEPFVEFDLESEVHRLKAETTWNTRQNARTLVKYDAFRVVVQPPYRRTVGARSRSPA